MDQGRIQRLIDEKRLEVAEAPDDEIVGLWQKAFQAHRDGRLAGLSLDGRFARAYDAGRVAATAIVRAAGYRVRSASHHHDTIYAALHIVDHEALEQALAELEEIRSQRHVAEYGWSGSVGRDEVESAIHVAERVINLGADCLREARPGIKSRLKKLRPRK